MKNRYAILAATFLLWTLVGVLGKAVFMLFYADLLSGTSAADWLSVLWHGLRLDIAIAGYLTMVPALMLIVTLWHNSRIVTATWKGYMMLTAALSAVAYIVNIGLYGYWGFPLDSTPLLYLRTSPADAMASMTFWQMAGGAAAIVITACLIYLLFVKTVNLKKLRPAVGIASLWHSLLLLIITASLIIPIRGGLSTGTNHTGSVYFSSNMRLNHAAVNPIFCFVESATHQENIGERYRFMDDAEAVRLTEPMMHTTLRTDTADVALRTDGKTNVMYVILEGFSRYIMSDAGNVKGVTPCLDAIADSAIFFTQFYANTFRTDRALPALLSALPSQPTMSIMDQPAKSNRLPSMAATLRKNGYNTAFYYGGDADYSNMRSYLMATGFSTVVAEENFERKLRTGKWGVADGPMLQRVAADAATAKQPFFCVALTGSSHEPFDVPGHSALKEPELNAFHYADSCLGRFITTLKASEVWKNTLVVIVPDHLGAYPKNIDNYQFWRYRLPLIFTGGVVEKPQRINTLGCQTDIPATVLAMLGYDHSDMPFSRDMLDPAAPHFAFFALDDGMGLVTDKAAMIHDNHAGKIVTSEGEAADSLLPSAKAYLQKVYDYLVDN